MRVARAVFAFTVLVIVGVRCGAQACFVVSDSEVEASARTRSVLRRLHDAGVDFSDLNTEESSLEDIFVSLVREPQ